MNARPIVIRYPAVLSAAPQNRLTKACNAFLSVCVLLALSDPSAHAQVSFRQPYTLWYGTTTSIHHILFMGDINRDGIPDLVTSARGLGGRLNNWIFFGQRPGIIDPFKHIEVEGAGSIATGDVNGDGIPDLVAQLWGPLKVAAYFGSAQGAYALDTIAAWVVSHESEHWG